MFFWLRLRIWFFILLCVVRISIGRVILLLCRCESRLRLLMLGNERLSIIMLYGVLVSVVGVCSLCERWLYR